MSPLRVLPAAALSVLAAISLAACGGGPSGPSIQVDQPKALIDQPLRISVSGLSPDEKVTVSARTVDSNGAPWSSAASFTADASGHLDLSRAAPFAGSYRVADGMGLLWAMLPTVVARTPIYVPPSSGEVVRLTVSGGSNTLTARSVLRTLTRSGVSVQHARLQPDGFYGEYFAPAKTSARRPAVLVFGGSEGGISVGVAAGLLASHGYPTLALAYFRDPGLPQTLEYIPLEYFAAALRWLRQRPGVDPAHVLTYGISRGSEAALLLGVHFPELVQGVIAGVPSNVALCSVPSCATAAWTLGGRALPYTRQFNQPNPTDDPAAVIPVERVHGPILLVCGGADRIWNSCPFAQAMDARLAAEPHPQQHVLLSFADAGHGVGLPVPYVPYGGGSLEGDTPSGNPAATEQAWPRLLAFLAATAPGS